MDDIYNKYTEALQEIDKLKQKISVLEHKLSMQTHADYRHEKENSENTRLLQRIEQLEKEKMAREQTSAAQDIDEQYKTIFKNMRRSITGLLGYKIDMRDDQIHLHSLYSFDRGDVFTFNVSGSKYEMVSNQFVETYRKELEMYVLKGKSVPAFLAYVTLDLFSKKTFQ